jgi:ABC-type Fe3+-citrate transport system substrate-binding protein
VLRWLSILVVALALVAAGCGGSDNESAASDETTTEETTTTDETTTEESTDTSGTTDTDATFNFASEDCQSLVKAYVGLSAAIAAASGGKDVSGDIEKFSKYVDEVPEEIRGDVQTIAAAYSSFADELKDIGYTPGQVPTADQLQKLQAASGSLGTSEVQAAGEHLNTWATENCKS